MQYPLAHSPFSRRGSYLQVELGFDFDSPVAMIGSARRSIWRRAGDGFGSHFFTIHTTRGDGYCVLASPGSCEGVVKGATHWRAALAGERSMILRGEAGGLRLTSTRSMSWGSQSRPDEVRLADLDGQCVHRFVLLGPGRLELRTLPTPDAKRKQGAAQHPYELLAHPAPGTDAVEVHYQNQRHEEDPPEPVEDLQAACQAATRDYRAWARKRPAVDPEFQDAAEFAWFMLWNQQVPAGGPVTRPAVIMSRFWMNSVWAWDACFSAIGIGEADPTLAWDQLLLHFDHQNHAGRLPDSVSDGGPQMCYVKPPIQGWAAMDLIDRLGVEACRDQLVELYPKLDAWSRWWRTHRCDRPDGLCHYMHGNDSGWDNATVFAEPGPVVAPDLQAFLIRQDTALARIAGILGRASDQAGHRRRAQAHLQAMSDGLVIDGRLGYIDPAGNLRSSTSTLTRMPILLGDQLPAEVADRIVADLSAGSPHVTRHGLATESTRSADYADDGYWRGPIWAPELYLAVDGLRRRGQTAAAVDLARRFCATSAATGSAMHENYDAQSGTGLRSPAYSWTAAVFIRLVHWLAQQDARANAEPVILTNRPAAMTASPAA
jgi:glycogen debranching enzyme